MMKKLVETTGPFQLVDYAATQQVVAAHRPSVVVVTDFIRARIGLDQIKVHGTVNEDATDAEFEKYWKDCESAELAVESFLASFAEASGSQKVAAPAAPAPEAAPAKRARAKAAE